jgi:hypothetical protein
VEDRTLAKAPVVTKVDPAKIYISWQTFASEGFDGVIRRGDRLRGTHPAVKRWPQFFVEDGTPEGEWPGLLDGTEEQLAPMYAERAAEQERKYPTIPESEVVICIEGFGVLGSAFVEVGARRRRTDPIVKKYPQFFADPPKPLAAR